MLYVQLLFINRYVNFPASIELSEDQKFEYQDTKTFVSPYQVRSSNVAYKFSKLLYIRDNLGHMTLMERREDFL